MALLQRIESGDRPASRGSATRRRTRRARLLAAAASALILATVLPMLLLGGSEGGVQTAAAKALRQVAEVAESQLPPKPPRPGQYLFTRSKVAYLEYSLQEGPGVAARIRREFKHVLHTHRGIEVPSWWYFVSQNREMWLDSKGSGSGEGSQRQDEPPLGTPAGCLGRRRLPSAAPGRPGQRKEIRQARSRCPLLLAPLAATHRTASAEEVDRSAQGSREGGPDRCGNHLDWVAPPQVRLRPDLRRGRLPPRRELRAPRSYARRSTGSPQNCPACSCSARSPIPSAARESGSHTPTPRMASAWS